MPWSPGDEHVGLPADTYAYLLGLYLGDGHLRAWGRSWILRIALDTGYPGIVDSCRAAVEALSGRPPARRPHHQSENCVLIESSWRSWPFLLPQHGPGRKHDRPIILEPWQVALVDQAPGALLRGLIHTDGWCGINRVISKGKAYEYPRYQFSNRSADIRRIFTDACDRLGIARRPWTRFHISVARRDAVALLARHVGPKA